MIGKQESDHSPIVFAIAVAETETTGEIRVHLSKRWWERDAMGRARRLFKRFKMSRTGHRNAVLLYVNLRRRKFAIFGDEGIHQAAEQHCWDRVARELRENLGSTHPENAIAMAVISIGEVLRKHFPAAPGSTPANELSNEVTED